MRSQMVGTILRSNVYLLTNYRVQVYRGDELWLSTGQPLLPDRDMMATNAWNEAYSLNLTSSLEDEEGETILWPRGVGACSCLFVRSFMISDILSARLTGSYEIGGIRIVAGG